MAANYTPISVGAPDNAATFNNPMTELSDAIGDLSTLKTTVVTSTVAAINSFYGVSTQALQPAPGAVTPGTIWYRTDGTAGNHWQGSDGSTWTNIA